MTFAIPFAQLQLQRAEPRSDTASGVASLALLDKTVRTKGRRRIEQ
ncbi:hypothetical protein [Xanthomonas hortorum]|uniref:Uncharacterized protein n=1 Tax=Xanthomonas hortorum pv. hederae TaxID=453603 RepID=A0A9X4BR13_9XANT|nr:hypothetical protein [Xanthomonas hortorum]MCE4372398.1 hypothetical protein [Xanthomonas hortorum pv. hederae]MDC8637652.1 hypothetical protein [Xanthomonas hortorum pv. hederae]